MNNIMIIDMGLSSINKKILEQAVDKDNKNIINADYNEDSDDFELALDSYIRDCDETAPTFLVFADKEEHIRGASAIGEKIRAILESIMIINNVDPFNISLIVLFDNKNQNILYRELKKVVNDVFGQGKLHQLHKVYYLDNRNTSIYKKGSLEPINVFVKAVITIELSSDNPIYKDILKKEEMKNINLFPLYKTLYSADNNVIDGINKAIKAKIREHIIKICQAKKAEIKDLIFKFLNMQIVATRFKMNDVHHLPIFLLSQLIGSDQDEEYIQNNEVQLKEILDIWVSENIKRADIKLISSNLFEDCVKPFLDGESYGYSDLDEFTRAVYLWTLNEAITEVLNDFEESSIKLQEAYAITKDVLKNRSYKKKFARLCENIIEYVSLNSESSTRAIKITVLNTLKNEIVLNNKYYKLVEDILKSNLRDEYVIFDMSNHIKNWFVEMYIDEGDECKYEIPPNWKEQLIKDENDSLLTNLPNTMTPFGNHFTLRHIGGNHIYHALSNDELFSSIVMESENINGFNDIDKTLEKGYVYLTGFECISCESKDLNKYYDDIIKRS